ncbi:sensor histidine kinase [Brevundimonas sp.]|uniref:sensor histidine kinase n=1 Tax=Brevundimonas sp. TaxID=1871086 RepID=UPI001A344656|nr:sensor histidine kinase [Brevundimonas sp.]MBJ7486073.1 MASE1 domain-containing protein [Brevundimonas sp.]
MSVSRVLEVPTRPLAPAPVRRPARARTAAGPGTAFAQPVGPLATACAVVLLTVLGIRFGMTTEGVVVMWLANAVASAIWVRTGKGMAFDLCFGGLVIAGLLAGLLLMGYPPLASLTLAAVNGVEIVVAVLLMRRFAPGQSLSTVRSAVTVIGVSALVAPLIGAGMGCLVLANLKGVPLLTGFQMWWFGHALGMMLILPIILGVNGRSAKVLVDPVRMAEWIGLLALLTAVAWAYYFLRLGPVSFILNMILVIIAARLRLTGVALSMLATAVIMFWSILHGEPPQSLVGFDPGIRVLTAQLMLLSVCMPFMLVAALLTQVDGLTERAKAGQQRAELASESKSRLLANVAHEIKSPVAGVIGIGDLWSSGQLGPVTATQREMADMLVKTARQVETLAHDLLDVARAESGAVKVELRPTDVVGVIEDVCRSTAMRPDAQGLKVTVDGDGIGLIALADSQRLTQVIDNFATNAVKYGSAGGAVTFRALRIPFGIRIEVSDKGPGLTSQKQTQLFEPFNRLGLERSTVEGHGIGLALAKRLVELQGGSIGVESAPGEGATFWVELPAA